MMYLLVLLCLALTVAVIQFKFYYRRRQLMSRTWDAVLDRVQPVDLNGIRYIAEFYLKAGRKHQDLKPDEMWRMVGGLAGIRRLKSNAAAMLDLAVFAESVFAERWNRAEGPSVSEMIRRDAVLLNKAVRGVELTFFLQFGSLASLPLQEAAASYCVIRGRLLEVYQNNYAGLMPRLVEVV